MTAFFDASNEFSIIGMETQSSILSVQSWANHRASLFNDDLSNEHNLKKIHLAGRCVHKIPLLRNFKTFGSRLFTVFDFFKS